MRPLTFGLVLSVGSPTRAGRTPQQIIEQMQPFIALGVDSFLLDCGGFPNLTTLELLVHEVLPVVTKATRSGAYA